MANLKAFLENNDVWVEGLCWSSFSQMPGAISNIDYEPSEASLVVYVHEQYGRFGNNIIQILHALIVAKNLSITLIYCKFFLDSKKTRSIIIDNVTIIFGCANTPDFPCISATMFYLQGFEKMVQSLNFNNVKYHAERLFHAIFEDQRQVSFNRDSEMVIFHFRSGDIFSSNRNPIYTQPPLSYYITALDHICSSMNNFHLYLVYEDKLNPCIEEFKHALVSRNLPFSEQSAKLSEDAALIASADCIVASYSSFCDVLALMNGNLKRWYSFRSIGAYEGIDLSISRYFSEILQNDGTQVYVVDDIKDAYIPLGKWTYSDEQKIELLQYPADYLKIRQIKSLGSDVNENAGDCSRFPASKQSMNNVADPSNAIATL